MNKQVNELVWANRAMVIEWAMANPEVKGEAIYWAMLGEDKLNSMADAIGGWGLGASEECDAIEALADEVIRVVEQMQAILADDDDMARILKEGGCFCIENVVEAVGSDSDSMEETVARVVRLGFDEGECKSEVARQMAELG